MSRTVRELDGMHLAEITKLHRYADPEATLKEMRARMERGKLRVFLLYEEGRPAGEAWLIRDGNGRLWLSNVSVLPAYRGKGAGRELTARVLEAAERTGETECAVGVSENNRIARHLYETLGFTEPIGTKEENGRNGTVRYLLLLRRPDQTKAGGGKDGGLSADFL